MVLNLAAIKRSSPPWKQASQLIVHHNHAALTKPTGERERTKKKSNALQSKWVIGCLRFDTSHVVPTLVKVFRHANYMILQQLRLARFSLSFSKSMCELTTPPIRFEMLEQVLVCTTILQTKQCHE